MKKSLILFAVLICFFFSSFAGSRDQFKIDEKKVYSEISELIELETYVTENNVTFSGLAATNNSLISNLAPGSGIMSLASFGEPPLGIPSFFWGFCLGLPGLAIVYFVAEDSDQTKKALWGCVAGGALYAIIYLVYVGLIVSSVTN